MVNLPEIEEDIYQEKDERIKHIVHKLFERLSQGFGSAESSAWIAKINQCEEELTRRNIVKLNNLTERNIESANRTSFWAIIISIGTLLIAIAALVLDFTSK